MLQLAVVMAKEDALSTELEEQQQEALASVIEEEETWLKALAQEQSSNIEMDTDCELGVGTDHRVCDAVQGVFLLLFFPFVVDFWRKGFDCEWCVTACKSVKVD